MCCCCHCLNLVFVCDLGSKVGSRHLPHVPNGNKSVNVDLGPIKSVKISSSGAITAPCEEQSEIYMNNERPVLISFLGQMNATPYPTS